jgi:hypothetical protein
VQSASSITGLGAAFTKFSNLARDLCWGAGRDNAVTVHASHERALEAAADLTCRNAPVNQFDIAVDNVAGVVVIGTVVGIWSDVITKVKNVERTGAFHLSHRHKIDGLYVTVEESRVAEALSFAPWVEA